MEIRTKRPKFGQGRTLYSFVGGVRLIKTSIRRELSVVISCAKVFVLRNTDSLSVCVYARPWTNEIRWSFLSFQRFLSCADSRRSRIKVRLRVQVLLFLVTSKTWQSIFFNCLSRRKLASFQLFMRRVSLTRKTSRDKGAPFSRNGGFNCRAKILSEPYKVQCFEVLTKSCAGIL